MPAEIVALPDVPTVNQAVIDSAGIVYISYAIVDPDLDIEIVGIDPATHARERG